MRFLTARRLALAALIPACLTFSLIPGCSNESEGERCGGSTADPNGFPDNDDCSSGLTCVLVNQEEGYRCCNSNLAIVNDSRCVRSVTPPSGDVDAGDSGTDSSASDSSASDSSASDSSASGGGGADASPSAGAGGN